MPKKTTVGGGNSSVATIGRGGSMERGSTILPNIHNQSVILDKNGEPLDVKIVKVKDLDQLSEINANEERRISLLPMSDDHRGAGK
jgi:hypothetical protein